MKTIRFALLGLALVSVLNLFAQDEIEAISSPVRVTFKPKDVSPPSVLLFYMNAGQLNAEGKVDVTLRIGDAGGLADISINEEKLNGEKKDSLILTRQFIPGQEVNVIAHDLANNTKERSFNIKGQIPPPVVDAAVATEEGPKHKYYALIMAVEKYEDAEINQLDEPVKDATALKQVLTTKYTFDEKDVTLLKNPTGDEMQLALEELANKVTANDLVLIFYAGHGYFDERKDAGYWFPRDARKSNTLRWFRNTTLVEDIRAIPAKHTLLIADACFSGGIFKSRAAFNNASRNMVNDLKTPSRKAMTSGALTTVPDKSVFMKYLLQLLNENNDLYLSSEELFGKLKPIVQNNSDLDIEPKYGEIKSTGDEGGIFYFMRRN